MIQLRVFVSLAIAVFLAGCVWAEAAGEVANANTASKSVNGLQQSKERVVKNAKEILTKARDIKSSLESHKTKAVRAELAVRTAAAEITAETKKEKAAAVVDKAKRELNECDKLYRDANQKADNASHSLNGFVSRAEALVQKAQNELSADSSKPDGYTKVIASTTTALNEMAKISQQIDERELLGSAKVSLLELRECAQKVQVLKYQAESLVIVSNIEAKMSEAEADIRSIQQNKEEINTIVQEMDTKFKSAPNSLKGFLNSLCTNAGGFLRTATNKLTEANKYNKAMQGKKPLLDQTLVTLMARTDEETYAGREASTVEWYEKFFVAEIEKIKQARKSAENYVIGAKNVQQQMQNEMSKTSSQSGTKLNKGQKMGKTSDQPVNANLDNTEQGKSTQWKHKEKQNAKHDNTESLNNDKLHKITKEVRNNPLISGEVSQWSSANDSAVTMFIPLLVAVIVSAVLH